MINIHSHVILGVDDGAKNSEESIQMLKMAIHDGVKGIIATPHYGRSQFEYDPSLMTRNCRLLEERIVAESLSIKIYPGHEAYLDEFLLEDLKNRKCLTLAGSRYVLVEILRIINLDIIKRMLFDIACSQYVPIIGHCERLMEKKEDHHRMNALKDMGCLLQVNANALFSTNEAWLKRRIHNGLKDGTISFIADDSHGVTFRPPLMKQAYDYVAKKMGKTIADDVMKNNPQKIILNLPMDS